VNGHLIAALQSLPADERAVVFLHDVLQWENQDVAELLGMSPESIDVVLQRARATLARVREVPRAPSHSPSSVARST
jgi:RNA polymerase sigma-70 factor (ECF subfamily)